MKCPKCRKDDNDWTLIGNEVMHNTCFFTDTCKAMLEKSCVIDY